MQRFALPRHSSITRTLPLSKASMSPNSSSGGQFPRTRTRVHGDLLADDETIGHELTDCLAGVGVGNFIHFVGVEPDLALAAANDGGREALLGSEIDPMKECWLAGELIW